MPFGGALSTLAAPLGILYGRAAAYRRRRYAEGRSRAARLTRPVVSVGNLTVGGTGKTPLVRELATGLCDAGLRVSVLSRGYGGRRHRDPMPVDEGEGATWRQVGDEPMLIARAEPRARVTVGRRRHEAGMMAEATGPVDIHLLDDGFQHLALARDLDVVMVPASSRLAEARCLPAGPYREPPDAVRGAAFVVVKSHDGGVPQRLAEEIRALGAGGPRLLGAALRARSLRPLAGGPDVDPSWLEGRSVAAFAGIGEPEDFHRLLASLGARVARFHAFPDHHVFETRDVQGLSSMARVTGAEALICTSKDAVRLGGVPTDLPVYALDVRLQVEAFQELLHRVMGLAGQGA